MHGMVEGRDQGIALDRIASIEGDRFLGWDLGVGDPPIEGQRSVRDYVSQWNLLNNVERLVERSDVLVLIRLAPEILGNNSTVEILARIPLRSVIVGITWPTVPFDVRRFHQVLEFVTVGGARVAAVDEGSAIDIMHHPVNDIARLLVVSRQAFAKEHGEERIRSITAYGSMVGLDTYVPERLDEKRRLLAKELGVGWCAAPADVSLSPSSI